MPAEERIIQLSLKGKAKIISIILHSSWVVSIVVLFLHIEVNTDKTSSKSTLATKHLIIVLTLIKSCFSTKK